MAVQYWSHWSIIGDPVAVSRPQTRRLYINGPVLLLTIHFLPVNVISYDSTTFQIHQTCFAASSPQPLAIPDVISTNANEIYLKWLNNTESLASKYRVTWLPRDGSQKTVKEDAQIAFRIENLNPATIYKIKMVSESKSFNAIPLTIIAATGATSNAGLSLELEDTTSSVG